MTASQLGPMIIPRPWTKQPQVATSLDLSNRLAENIHVAINWAEIHSPMNGSPFTYLQVGSVSHSAPGVYGHRKNTWPTSTTGLIWNIFVQTQGASNWQRRGGPKGLVGLHNNVSGVQDEGGVVEVDHEGLARPADSDWSLTQLIQFHDSAKDQALFGMDTDGASAATFQLWADTDAGALRLAAYDGTQFFGTAGALDDNKRVYQITFTYDSAGSGTLKGYIDGVEALAPATFAPGTDGTEFLIGGTGGATSLLEKSGNKTMFLSVMHNRTLTPSEVVSFVQNPWQIFKPRTLYVGKPKEQRLVVF